MRKFNKNDLVKRVLLFVFALILISSCFAVVAYACDVSPGSKPADTCTDKSHWDAYASEKLSKSGMFGWLKCMVYYVKSFVSFGSTQIIGWATSFIKFPFPANLDQLIDSVSVAISSIGKMLCFLYFLLEIMEHATRDTFSAEAFVKALAKLMIMFVLFDPTTLDIIDDFGGSLNKFLMDKISDGNTMYGCSELNELINELDSAWGLACLGLLFKPENGLGLSALLTMFTASVVAVGRLVELTVYRSMLPLGMASIYTGGLHSSGFRYIKKCIALEIQGAIMFCAVLATVYASNAVLGQFIPFMDFAIGLAGISIVVKSKAIANDVIGA